MGLSNSKTLTLKGTSKYKELTHAIDKELLKQNCSCLEHLRLSVLSSGNKRSYTGLTKAKINKQPVMVKWSLTNDMADHSSINNEVNIYAKIINASSGSMQHLSSNCALNIFQSSIHFSTDFDPHIVPIIYSNKITIDYLEKPGCASKPWYLNFLVMPYYQQGNVRQYINKNPLTTMRKCQLVYSIAKTLASFHCAGWIHGDIKPSNIIVSHLPEKIEKYSLDANKRTNMNPYRTYLIDLALAKAIESNIDTKSSAEPQLQVTKGTPAYLAPECWQGRPLTKQSDIYAFGVTMYEILTGIKPLIISSNGDCSKSTQWAMAHCQAPIPLLPSQDFAALQPILNKLLAKQKAKRYQSMQEVLQDLSVTMVAVNQF